MKHIAFLMEPSYGHLVPTLGIAAELMRRGYRVTYAINDEFADRIVQSGAQAIIYRPKEGRLKVFREADRGDGTFDFNADGFMDFIAATKRELNQDACAQLLQLYAGQRPDLIVHVTWLSPAAKALAAEWNIPRVVFFPALVDMEPPDDDLILVSVPRFFQRNAETFASRFHFIGFTPDSRRGFFKPWQPARAAGSEKLILVSATTGLLPQVEFFRRAIRAFGNQPWRVVVSIGSQVSASDLAPLPENVEINAGSSNLEILEHAHLFVGQGGQGSTLEALYCGVPPLLVPPAPAHNSITRRILELGLGAYLAVSEATPEDLRRSAALLLEDSSTLARVREAQKEMRKDDGPKQAATLIEEHLSSFHARAAAAEASPPVRESTGS